MKRAVRSSWRVMIEILGCVRRTLNVCLTGFLKDTLNGRGYLMRCVVHDRRPNLGLWGCGGMILQVLLCRNLPPIRELRRLQ